MGKPNIKRIFVSKYTLNTNFLQWHGLCLLINMKNKEFYFQWHITKKCNLRCSHCYQEDYSAFELPPETLISIADKIIDALKQWDMHGRISLTGGEPFMSKSLFVLMDKFENSDEISKLGVLSNGTIVTEQIINQLKKYKKLSEIQISLDGANEETHDSIRGTGTFQKTIKSIELLKENNFFISIMFTLTSINKTNIDELLNLCDKLNIDALTVERVTPCSNSSSNLYVSKEELSKIYNKIAAYKEQNKKYKIRTSRPLWTLTNHEYGGFCPVGFSSLAILEDGTVLPCRRLNIPIGNILTDSLYKIWYTSDVLWNIRNKKLLKGKCNSCENLSNCSGCRAIAYEITGDYLEEDPQCWK